MGVYKTSRPRWRILVSFSTPHHEYGISCRNGVKHPTIDQLLSQDKTHDNWIVYWPLWTCNINLHDHAVWQSYREWEILVLSRPCPFCIGWSPITISFFQDHYCMRLFNIYWNTWVKWHNVQEELASPPIISAFQKWIMYKPSTKSSFTTSKQE